MLCSGIDVVGMLSTALNKHHYIAVPFPFSPHFLSQFHYNFCIAFEMYILEHPAFEVKVQRIQFRIFGQKKLNLVFSGNQVKSEVIRDRL